MAYTQEISRTKPSAFLFLIDQSGSMGEGSGVTDKDGNPLSKAEAVADAVNSVLEEIINRCQRAEGVRDYFDIALIGYGIDSSAAQFIWEGNIAGKTWVKTSEVKENATEETYIEETVVRGKIEEEEHTRLIWLKPAAVGLTPMYNALDKGYNLLQDWINLNSDSFPPIVINITDGIATDVSDNIELINITKKISDLQTSDGNVLVFNCHIASNAGSPVLFPSSKNELPNDEYAHLLFDMSSDLPTVFLKQVIEMYKKDPATCTNARGMAYNARIVDLIKLLDIGTKTATDKTT